MSAFIPKTSRGGFLSQKSASCKRKGRSMMWWNSECINIWESSAFVIHRLFSLPACCSLCGPPWARECPLGFNRVIWWVSRSNRNDPYSFWHPCIITMHRCKHLRHYLIMQRECNILKLPNVLAVFFEYFFEIFSQLCFVLYNIAQFVERFLVRGVGNP